MQWPRPLFMYHGGLPQTLCQEEKTTLTNLHFSREFSNSLIFPSPFSLSQQGLYPCPMIPNTTFRLKSFYVAACISYWPVLKIISLDIVVRIDDNDVSSTFRWKVWSPVSLWLISLWAFCLLDILWRQILFALLSRCKDAIYTKPLTLYTRTNKSKFSYLLGCVFVYCEGSVFRGWHYLGLFGRSFFSLTGSWDVLDIPHLTYFITADI